MEYIYISYFPVFPGISREIPVFPAVLGNTLISRLFDNPDVLCIYMYVFNEIPIFLMIHVYCYYRDCFCRLFTSGQVLDLHSMPGFVWIMIHLPLSTLILSSADNYTGIHTRNTDCTSIGVPTDLEYLTVWEKKLWSGKSQGIIFFC